MKARLGIAPIAWSNDDLPELGGDTTLETCLRESREAGFSGVETGGKFPKTAAELGPNLEAHGLMLASGWYSGTVLDAPDDLAEEKDKVAAAARTVPRRSAPPALPMARRPGPSRTSAKRRWPPGAGCRKTRSRPMAGD